MLSGFMSEHLHLYDELEQLPIEKAEGAEYSFLADKFLAFFGRARFEQLPRLDFQVDEPTYEKMRMFFQGLQAQLIDDCLED